MCKVQTLENRIIIDQENSDNLIIDCKLDAMGKTSFNFARAVM